MQNNEFYKNNPADIVSWVAYTDNGTFQFTFDKITIFNLFEDYPYKLTTEQKAIFDSENPNWRDFFKDRQ